MKRLTVVAAVLFVFIVSAKVEGKCMMGDQKEHMKKHGIMMGEGIKPMMKRMGQDMMMKDMMQMMKDMLRIQKYMLKDMKPSEKKEALREVDKMMDRIDNMMSEMRGMMMHGMKDRNSMESCGCLEDSQEHKEDEQAKDEETKGEPHKH